jgi:Tfp pilus assembly protein PilW
MNIKFKKMKGLSLAEVLVAIVITNLIFAAAYLIYNNFQSSFDEQLSMNELKEEGRAAIKIIETDARNAGYRSSTIVVQSPVIIQNNSLSFCFDDANVRKRVDYLLDVANKNLTRRIYNSSNCGFNGGFDGTDIIARSVSFFSAYLTPTGNILDIKIGLVSQRGDINETYDASFFLKNLTYAN